MAGVMIVVLVALNLIGSALPSNREASRAEAVAPPNTEELVKAELRDPESASFQNVRTMSDGTVCGEVNAKNGFGGYTGFTEFVIIHNRVTIRPARNSEGFAVIWKGMCH